MSESRKNIKKNLKKLVAKAKLKKPSGKKFIKALGNPYNVRF